MDPAQSRTDWNLHNDTLHTNKGYGKWEMNSPLGDGMRNESVGAAGFEEMTVR